MHDLFDEENEDMAYETVLCEKQDGVGILTLNRPTQLNALSPQLVAEAGQVMGDFARDPKVKVVIITGGNKVFCAGADLESIMKSGDLGRPRHKGGPVELINTWVNGLEDFEKPVIAAVAGYALGGGCELALVCDLRFAAPNARFGVPEIKVGLIPGAGGTQRLPRIIGITRAKELLYTGNFIDAEEAYRIGLVNRVVPLESLMDECHKMARVLMERPPIGLSLAKKCVNVGMQMDLASGLELERRCIDLLNLTEDTKEGVSAFVEKRKPNFQGR